MNAIDAVDIYEFVNLQRQLLLEFSRVYPGLTDYKWLTDFPLSGTLRVGASDWAFLKHGAGLRFVRLSPPLNLVVDIHKRIDDPDMIDEWRLEQYFESRGSDASREKLTFLLADMFSQGALIEQQDGQYSLRS